MISLAGRAVDAILFDKDGTLLDFHETWDRAIGATLRDLTTDSASLEGAAKAVGYDLVEDRVAVGSPIVAESNATIMGLLDDWLDTSGFENLLMDNAAASAHPAAGASSLLQMLVDASISVGLITNDSEAVARAQLTRLGWAPHFSVVIGYDSGFGAKPDPGPVLAGIDRMGVARSATIMVGDSMHDVQAAHEAGVVAVALGNAAELLDRADIVVADLAEFAELLE